MIYDDYLFYKKYPILFVNSRIKSDVFLIGKYMEYHITDSLRCIRAFSSLDCYNDMLFGDRKIKKNRISYYHHYVISLLTNLGLIIDGQNILEESIGGKIYDFNIEKGARNTIIHIFEKTKKYYGMGLNVNGFNVIEEDRDFKFRDIKTPLGTLDLIDKKFITYGDQRKNKDEESLKSYIIDLLKIEKDLENYNIEIQRFNEYVGNYFKATNV